MPVKPGEAPVDTELQPALSTARLDSAKRYRIPMPIVSALSLIVLLAFWEVFGRQINPIFASHPTAIASSFWNLASDGRLLVAFIASIQPLALGYTMAAVVGIPLGLFIGRFRYVEAALGMYVVAGYATPLVALIPLFILWFGLGGTVKVAIVFVMSIFPIVINTWAGVHAVPKTLVEVGVAFVASKATILRKIVVPATVPYIMTGLRLGIGRAVIAVVIAEFFTAISGLGGLIIRAGHRFDTAEMFVPVVILMILGVGFTNLIGVLERKVAPWQQQLSAKDS